MTSNNVYITRGNEVIKPLGAGAKTVYVSGFNGRNMVHIRKFHGETLAKYPTRYGITLTREEFEELVGLRDFVLTEFDRVSSAHESATTTTTAPHTSPVDYNPYRDFRYNNEKENALSTLTPDEGVYDDTATLPQKPTLKRQKLADRFYRPLPHCM